MVAVPPALAGSAGGVGAAPSPSPTPPARTAPARPANPATIGWTDCRSRCRRGQVRPGSLVRLHGSGLNGTARIVFLGHPGSRDDVSARALRVRSNQVDVRVPPRVVTGPVDAVTAHGVASAPSRANVVVVGSAAPVQPTLTSVSLTGAPASAHGQLVDIELDSTKIVYDTAPPTALHITASAGRPVDVSVAVVRQADGTQVATWATRSLAAGAQTTLTWNGPGAGQVPPGEYAFQVFARPAGSPASSAQAQGPDVTQPFTFQPYVFPVAGPHTFNMGAGRFGAARGGYRHEGQDVMSPCGTPLLAARGGVVKFRAYQSRAGNYLVINPDGTPQDMVYMHLRSPALVARGAHVATGQLIGYVGRTGDATACHLHFELWTGPGWYTGGHPIDPLPSLEAWQAQGVPAPPASSTPPGGQGAPASTS